MQKFNGFIWILKDKTFEIHKCSHKNLGISPVPVTSTTLAPTHCPILASRYERHVASWSSKVSRVNAGNTRERRSRSIVAQQSSLAKRRATAWMIPSLASIYLKHSWRNRLFPSEITFTSLHFQPRCLINIAVGKRLGLFASNSPALVHAALWDWNRMMNDTK